MQHKPLHRIVKLKKQLRRHKAETPVKRRGAVPFPLSSRNVVTSMSPSGISANIFATKEEATPHRRKAESVAKKADGERAKTAERPPS